jgi:isopentenyldiphosphate isomerase
MATADELVDVVDEQNNVIAVARRGEIRGGRLRHRAVFVLVRSSTGDVLIHRRADHKDVWPGWWDLAAGGVVNSGEDYASAAERELAEELGVTGVPLTLLAIGAYEDDDVAEISAVYTVMWDGPVQFSDGEVAEAHWVTPDELALMVASDRPFVPDSVALVLPHVRENV